MIRRDYSSVDFNNESFKSTYPEVLSLVKMMSRNIGALASMKITLVSECDDAERELNLIAVRTAYIEAIESKLYGEVEEFNDDFIKIKF